MTDSDVKVGVQILNYNGADWLKELLPTLVEHHDENSVVYLLDNASVDDSVAVFREMLPHGKVIHLAVNCGFSPAYNLAIDTAWADGCDWVCLLNNDIRVSDGWIDPVRRLHQKDSKIGIVGSAFRDWKGSGANAFMKGRHPELASQLGTTTEHDVDWVEGSSMFIRKECWKQLGPFDPNYFIFWDETEYCRRARLNDWRVVLALDSVVEHFGGGSVSSDSAFRKPLMQRNCYAFKLTDPQHSFSRNTLHWMRLLVTESRQILRTKNPLSTGFGWLRNIGQTILSIPKLYRRHQTHVSAAPLTLTDGSYSAVFSDLSHERRAA